MLSRKNASSQILKKCVEVGEKCPVKLVPKDANSFNVWKCEEHLYFLKLSRRVNDILAVVTVKVASKLFSFH